MKQTLISILDQCNRLDKYRDIFSEAELKYLSQLQKDDLFDFWCEQCDQQQMIKEAMRCQTEPISFLIKWQTVSSSMILLPRTRRRTMAIEF